MYKRIYKLIDGEKNAKMVKSGGKDRGSNQRFTDTRVYWKLEAENGRTKWERQRERKREKSRATQRIPREATAVGVLIRNAGDRLPRTLSFTFSPPIPISFPSFLSSFFSFFLPMYTTNFSSHPFLLLPLQFSIRVQPSPHP